MAIDLFRQLPYSPYTGRRPVINRGHPLAQGMVGAWLGNAAGSGGGAGPSSLLDQTLDVAYGQDGLRDITATASTKRVSPAGPGIFNPVGTSTTSGALSARLKISPVVSIIWYGVITANESAAGAAFLAGASYDSSNGSPFDCYTIHRPSGLNTNIAFDYNDGSNAQGLSISGQIASSDYNCNPMLFGASFGLATVHAYKNGVQIGTAARIGSTIAYGATAGFSLSGTYRAGSSGDNPNAITVLALVWNRELSATEHMLLGVNPWQVFAIEHNRRLAMAPGSAPANLSLNIWETLNVEEVRPPTATINAGSVRISQLAVETISAQAITPAMRISQLAVEAISAQAIAPAIRISQLAVETLSLRNSEKTATETITVTENVAPLLTSTAIIETITVTDAVSLLADTQKLVAESVTVTEGFAAVVGQQGTYGETIFVTDVVTTIADTQKLIAESATVADVVTRTIADTQKLVVETITTTENVAAQISLPLIVFEAIGVTEHLTTSLTGERTYDRIFVTDAVFVAFNVLIAEVAESIGVSEGGLNSIGTGTSTGLGPNPSPIVVSNTGDYWVVGI